MKQIVIISGKGGTGKTVFAGSAAVLAEESVIADCDVDASNLHFLLNPVTQETHPFQGGDEAVVDSNKCTGCMKCEKYCRFLAIQQRNGTAEVDPIMCEGCAVCYTVCPERAISMEPRESGEWYVSRTDRGPMVHANLFAGEENSGKLVSEVRKRAKEIAEQTNQRYVVVDGPPGMGCAVIATLSGADLAVVVTEPSYSGIHDMKRVIELADHFSIKTGVVINKYTINEGNTAEIERFCSGKHIPVFGKIPYSSSVVEAVSQGIPSVEYSDDEVSSAIKKAWGLIQHTITRAE